MKRHRPTPWLIVLFGFLSLLSSVRPANAQPSDRDLGNSAYTKFRARSDKFTTEAEACRHLREVDGGKYSGHREDAEGRVTCKYKLKTKQGGKEVDVDVEQGGVVRVLACPAGATLTDKDGKFTANARSGTCMCNVGLVALAGACIKASPPADTPTPTKPKEEAKCTWAKPNTQTNDTSKNAALLRKTLGGKPGDQLEAHHIVFSTWKDGQRGQAASASRAILEKYCIDINGTENGALLDHKQHHGKGLHTIVGAEKVRDELGKATTRSEALVKLAALKRLILAGNLLPGYVPKKSTTKKPTAPEPTECTEEDE